MKVYLSADYHKKELLREYAETLKNQGLIIHSTWILESDDNNDISYRLHNQCLIEEDWDFFKRISERDAREIKESDIFILFSNWPQKSRGGRHVEAGIALAYNIPIVIIGPRETSFYYNRDIKQYDSLNDFLKELGELKVEIHKNNLGLE